MCSYIIYIYSDNYSHSFFYSTWIFKRSVIKLEWTTSIEHFWWNKMPLVICQAKISSVTMTIIFGETKWCAKTLDMVTLLIFAHHLATTFKMNNISRNLKVVCHTLMSPLLKVHIKCFNIKFTPMLKSWNVMSCTSLFCNLTWRSTSMCTTNQTNQISDKDLK